MSRPLILHVGVQKTGSTSVQRFLNLSADDLADLVVIRTPEEGTPMRPLGRAAMAFSQDPAADNRDRLVAAFRAVLETIPAGPQPVVISHENLAGAMPGTARAPGLYPALPDIVTLLCQTARAAGFDPRIVVCTRARATWLPSVWAQAVRTDGYDQTYDSFLTQTADLPGWGDLVARLSAAERDVTRLRMERDIDSDRPGRALLALAGVPDARLDALPPRPDPAMTRLNPGATEFLRRLNELQLNPHARGRVADLVARSHPLFAARPPSDGTP